MLEEGESSDSKTGFLISQSNVLSFGPQPLGCNQQSAYLAYLNVTNLKKDIIPFAVSPGAAVFFFFFSLAHVHANLNRVIFI